MQAEQRLEEIESIVKDDVAVPDGKAAPLGRWIDLISLVDPEKHQGRGSWTKQSGRLMVRGENGVGQLALIVPVSIVGSYDLQIDLVRTGGQEIQFFLPIAGRRPVCFIDAIVGSGLEKVDGMGVKGNSTFHPARLLQTGEPTVFKFNVRVEGDEAAVMATMNGQSFINWRGPVASISIDHRVPESPSPNALWLGGWSNVGVDFHAVRLRMISGQLTKLAGNELAANALAGGNPNGHDTEKGLDAGAISYVPRAKLTDHRFNINGLAFVPGNMLASCDTESILFWNPKTWTSTAIIDKNQQGSEIYRFAFSPDGKTLAARGKDSVKLWDVATRKIRYEFRKGEVKSLEFSPDGKTLAATVNGGAALFDGSGEERHIDDDPRAMLRVAFSPDGRFVAVAGFRGDVRLYSVASGELVSAIGQSKAKQAVAWSPGGKMIATAGDNPTLEIYDVETKKLLGTLPGHTGWVTAAEFIPNTSPPLLATASRDKTVRIWNPAAGKQIASLPGHQDEVNALAVSPDGRALASGDKNGVILVWEIRKSR